MQTSNTSAAKKVVVGLVLGAGIILGVSSSACSVSVSNTCTGGDVTCGDGTCGLPDNVACNFNSDCCSNYCALDGFCGLPPGQCLADNVACSFDSDCCSYYCASDGLCGCIPSATSGCYADSDCCSNFCDLGTHVCN